MISTDATDALYVAIQALIQQVQDLRRELRDLKGKPAAEDRFVGIRELEEMVSVGRVTIWRWYRAGKFPNPVHFGTRRVWRLSEVRNWIAQSDGAER